MTNQSYNFISLTKPILARKLREIHASWIMSIPAVCLCIQLKGTDQPVMVAHLRQRLKFELKVHAGDAVLRLRRSICHMRGFISTNARKIYYHLRVSIARFLITFTDNLDIQQVPCT